jgi:hypothetical protein
MVSNSRTTVPTQWNDRNGRAPFGDSQRPVCMRVWGMRTGVSITLGEADSHRLDAFVAERNTLQKHVWRARIVLLSAAGGGTNAVMAVAGKSNTGL